MQLNLLLGNQTTKQSIKTALVGKKLPHALLVCAQNGCGRGFAARCIAADYLYPQGGAAAAAVLQMQSPEFILVQGEGKSGQISIESIRMVRSDIFLSSLSAAGRVVWVKDAHKMAAPAANALLKVLEEPPVDVLFILTAANAAALPLTLRSRCAVYALAALPVKHCQQALQKALPPGANQNLPALLATLYGGRLGAGLKALQNPARLALAQDALCLAKAAAAGDSYQLLRIFAAYEGRKDEDRPKRQQLLEDFAAALGCGLLGTVAPGLPQIPPGRAAALLPRVIHAQNALAGNAPPKLFFAALTVQLTSTA